MTDLERGPEVPFPLNALEDVMCRDCPFPMKENWPDDVRQSFEDWRKKVLDLTAVKLRESGSSERGGAESYAELIGKTLEVVRPDGGARMIYNPSRLLVHVDEQEQITRISIGS